MTISFLIAIILAVLGISTTNVDATPALKSSEPQVERDEVSRVSLCEVMKDPAAFNKTKIEVIGFVSRGFEDSGLFDPTCSSHVSIWVEIGGTKRTGTMYCCGVSSTKTRPQELMVDGISLPLADDKKFLEFEEMFQKMPDSIVRASLVGTYFSGEKQKFPGGEFWVGYGHMGMSSLFVIQQVLSVDPRDRKDVDYRSSSDQPDLEKERCGSYQILRDESGANGLIRQASAERDQTDWAFDDPRRVATEDLARLIGVKAETINLVETRRSQGRIIYHWRPNGRKGVRYMVQASKPYTLVPSAKDPNRIVWLSSAYKVCT